MNGETLAAPSIEDRARVRAQVRSCRACELGLGSAVAFSGPSRPKLIVVGEAPGEQEVIKGRPFVGRSGRLLVEGLEGIGLERGDVFFLNAVSHHPIGNATPTPAQVAACFPIFDAQFALADCPWILAAGSIALGQFLPGARITAWVAYPFAWGEKFVYPMLHPAAALRSGAKKEWKESLGNLECLLDVPSLISLFPPRCVAHLVEGDCLQCQPAARLKLGSERRHKPIRTIRGV